MPKFLLHSLFLLTAVVLAFFWTSQPGLSLYTLQLVAIFVLVFFANQLVNPAKRGHRTNLTIDAIIFTLVTLLLVISTGGLTSPLFFLLYFLMFGLSLLFEPLISLSLTGAMTLFFAISPTDKSGLEEILQLLSLIMVTPLAVFFGGQYLKVLRDEEKIKILEEEGEVLEKEIQKEETDVLLWTSLELKHELAGILDGLSDLLTDIGHLTFSQKEKLLKIREQALRLLKSGQKLKEEVDKTTDE